jgi:hypothetical protein
MTAWWWQGLRQGCVLERGHEGEHVAQHTMLAFDGAASRMMDPEEWKAVSLAALEMTWWPG